MALAFIMFSFGGLEMLGFTAAEADKPKTVIPKAINQVIYRILIFYVGALVVLLSLTPWDTWSPASTPPVAATAAARSCRCSRCWAVTWPRTC
jgi:L-asparagine transporter-like permease